MDAKQPKDFKQPVRPGKQVQTVVDFTGPQPIIKLECKVCHTGTERIGAKFCSNCGEPLKWDDIWVRKPEDKKVADPVDQTQETPPAHEDPAPKGKVN